MSGISTKPWRRVQALVGPPRKKPQTPPGARGRWVLYKDAHRFVPNESVVWVDGRQHFTGQGMVICLDCGAEGYDDCSMYGTGTWRYFPLGLPKRTSPHS